MQAFDKPAGFLQMVAQKRIIGAVIGAADQRCIIGIHTQFRGNIRVQLNPPFITHIAHNDIGDDVLGLFRTDSGAGLWRQFFNEPQHCLEIVFAQTRFAHQGWVIFAAQ